MCGRKEGLGGSKGVGVGGANMAGRLADAMQSRKFGMLLVAAREEG